MQTLKIELKNGYETIKAIYYRNGNGSIFTYSATRHYIPITIIFFIGSAFLYALAIRFPETVWILLFILSAATSLILTVQTIIRSQNYLKWKRSSDEYLNGFRKYESQWLTISQDCIEISNSDEISIEKWETISHVSIKADYIYLRSSVNGSYLFPEKCMEPGQYLALEEFIQQRMNDGGLS
jgi:hypothetical protein